MRLSTIGPAAVLLFSTAIFSTAVLAQHGGGGGGSSGSSSSSSSSGWSGGGGGGGGSHGGSSGGSSASGSSGGSHSSGGSGSHASSTTGSSGHGSSAHASNSGSPSVRGSNSGTRAANQAAPKKTFFSILTYPFRKPAPKPEPTTKPVANLRRPVCVKGLCAVCPTGKAGCGGATVTSNRRHTCSAGEIWSGGACLQQLHFLDECSALRQMLEQQRQRMQAAEVARQSACSAGSSQECSEETSASEIEAGRYQDLQSRYDQCRMRSPTAYPYSASAFASWRYSSGLSFDRLQAEAKPTEVR